MLIVLVVLLFIGIIFLINKKRKENILLLNKIILDKPIIETNISMKSPVKKIYLNSKYLTINREDELENFSILFSDYWIGYSNKDKYKLYICDKKQYYSFSRIPNNVNLNNKFYIFNVNGINYIRICDCMIYQRYDKYKDKFTLEFSLKNKTEENFLKRNNNFSIRPILFELVLSKNQFDKLNF